MMRPKKYRFSCHVLLDSSCSVISVTDMMDYLVWCQEKLILGMKYAENLKIDFTLHEWRLCNWTTDVYRCEVLLWTLHHSSRFRLKADSDGLCCEVLWSVLINTSRLLLVICQWVNLLLWSVKGKIDSRALEIILKRWFRRARLRFVMPCVTANYASLYAPSFCASTQKKKVLAHSRKNSLT